MSSTRTVFRHLSQLLLSFLFIISTAMISQAAVTIGDVTVAENGTMTFTATSADATAAFTVDVAFTDGTATGGGTDYDSGVQSLSFSGAAGEAKTFTVTLNNDVIVEDSETFTVNMQNINPAATTVITDTAVGTITDNDTATVTVGDVTAAENGTITFTAQVDNAVAGGFTVDVAFADVSATGGTDYTSTVQTLTFAGTAAETQTFTVPLTDDSIVESSETFTVSQQNAVSPGTMDISDTAVGTITDNDTSEVSLTATAAPSEPSTDGEFTVTLTNPSSSDTDISYTVAGTATSGADFTALSGVVTVPVNTLTATIPILIIDDAIVEGTESVALNITGTNNGSITVAAAPGDTAQVIFGDNDVATLTVEDVSVLEDGTMTFAATVDNAVDGGFDVDISFVDGGAVGGAPLAAGIDYNNSTQTLTFVGNVGETQTFTVPLNSDLDVEPPEDFQVGFTNVVPVTAPVSQFNTTDMATGTILNDEHFILMSAGSNGGMNTTYDGSTVVGPGSLAVKVDHESTPLFNATPDSCYEVDDMQVNGSSVGAVASYTFPSVITENQTINTDFVMSQYTITATVLGNNGTLTPTQTVNCGSSGYAYTAQADSGYHITWFKVNGVAEAGAVGNTDYTYTFGAAITSDQTIEVAYTQILTIIEESPFGEVVPDGDKDNFYEVDYGSDLVLTVDAYVPCPNGLAHDGNDHHVSDILLDGVSIGGLQGAGLTSYTYTLANITDEHSIEILFTSYVDVTVHPNGQTESPVVTTVASIEVEAKTDHDITAVPITGFHVSDVEVDAASVGTPELYTFGNMTDKDHTYEVWFAIDTFTLEPASRFNTIFNSSAESVVATTRQVDWGTDSSFFVNLNDPDHVVMGILVDNVSYTIPVAGATETYTDFQLINTANDYLEVKFTNVVVSHRLEVLDYDTSPISDFPLDAKLRPKPASLMFVLDDSGSMDWEFIVPGNGLYNGRYYVYNYPAVPEARAYWDNSMETSGLQGQWRSQWSAINKMFYNPDVNFVPWPNFIGTSPSSNLPAASGSVAGQSDGQSHANIYRPRYHPWYSQDCTEALNKVAGATPDNTGVCNNNETFDMDSVFQVVTNTDDHGNTTATATEVSVNDSYVSELEVADDNDMYKIVLTSAGDLTVRTLMTSECTDTMARILDSGGAEYRAVEYADSWTDPYSNGNWYDDDCGGAANCDFSCDNSYDRNPYIQLNAVPAGTYYIDVRGWDSTTGTYTLDIAFSGTSTTFPAPATASPGIINAHYYTWEDVDGDGTISYTDSNNNGQLDIDETVNETIWLVNLTNPIEYYRVLDNSQDVSGTNLQVVAAASVPAEVKTFVPPTDADAWLKERQNWANWFSYYRKRTYAATAAVAQIIDQMSNVEVGFHTINYNNNGWKNGGYGISQSLLPLKVVGVGDEKNRLLELLYGFQIAGYGTPLRRGLESVGEYYDDTDGTDNGGIANNSGSPFGTPIESPFHAQEDGDACKQAFTIAMTDGYWNGWDPAVGNADGDNGAPYADEYSNTLADVAMDFFERDLSTMENLVPDGVNTHQHMVTYTVAFGVKGTLDPDDYDLNNSVYPTWPSPWASSEARVDDLWHAAVNGHGSYMNASRPDELVASLLAIMNDIGSRIGSGASVSVNGDEMYEAINGQIRMFQTTYNSGDWHGDLQSYKVDATTGEVLTNSPVWSAEEKMATQLNTTGADGRIIATYNNSKGVPFRWNNGGSTDDLSTLQKKQLLPYFADTLTGENVVDYLRGDKANEGSFRGRDGAHPLGDFIHSLARYDDGILYVGSNDGMLHAFYADDAKGGEELFAYVPSFVYSNLRELANPLYDHKYFVDNTPFTKKFDTTTLLVGGLGKGGAGYYCLDISNAATSITDEATLASRVKWEYPAAPATLLTGTTFSFESGTGSGGNDRILDSANQFTETNGFDEDNWIAIVGANHNGYTNDGVYQIQEVASDGSYIELMPGSLIDTYGDGDDVSITRVVGDSGLGYSFSRPVIVKTYDLSINAGTEFEGYVVIFGNGYGSEDGTASLYILNPVTGSLLKKIETDVGPFNGMSTPKAIDDNNDLKVDYVYAGDLLGNMWKFDLTSSQRADWQVAYCDNGDSAVGGSHCKDTVSGMKPQPLFAGLSDQAITGSPDIMFHKSGYGFMVIFGTGKYLGEPDLSSLDVQSLYGIWDWAPDHLDEGYHGARVDNSSVATLSNWPETNIDGEATHTLLEQVSWVEGQLTEDTDGDGKLDVDEDLNNNGVLDTGEDIDGDGHLDYDEDTNNNGTIDLYNYYRITSNFQGDFSLETSDDLSATHHLYNKDINGDGDVDTFDKVPAANVGWFYDLPGMIDFPGDGLDNDGDTLVDEDDNSDGIIDERKIGERVVNDTIIRDGKAIMLSFGITSTGCSSGAYSLVNERNPHTGGMLLQPAFDIDGDGEVNMEDLVYTEVPYDIDGDGDIDKDDVVAGVPTDRAYEGRLFNPAILREDEAVDDDGEELKYFSTSQGSIQTMTEAAERRGIYFWQQVE